MKMSVTVFQQTGDEKLVSRLTWLSNTSTFFLLHSNISHVSKAVKQSLLITHHDPTSKVQLILRHPYRNRYLLLYSDIAFIAVYSPTSILKRRHVQSKVTFNSCTRNTKLQPLTTRHAGVLTPTVRDGDPIYI